ncbi:MAG: PHP domain-containing protein [bacterium]
MERQTGTQISVYSEEDLYQRLGLDFIVPELREDRGEIEAGAAGQLPKLLVIEDIKGDFHCHTAWSDGIDNLEKLVLAARGRGYAYLGITDHSQTLKVAQGLTIEQLRKQGAEIKALNRKYPDFKILHGAEVDILADGSLDYPDEVLAELDVVIASIHSHFRQDRATMTGRILKAISNPHVDILAHPTGRILGRREGYPVDLEQVIAKAAATRTVLEINASPDRLDLNDVWVRRAKECGVKIAINTDAHEEGRLEEISFGITVARRGWLEKDDVINTWPWERVRAYFTPG